MNRAILFYGYCLFLGGCQPFVDHRGLNVEERQLKQIVIGSTNKEKVREILGAPSTTSTFKIKPNIFERWFYIYYMCEQKSFFDPKIKNKKTIEIVFDDQGVVRRILNHDCTRGLTFDPHGEVTPSSGYESSMLRDIFGNFGRYGVATPGDTKG